MFFLVPVEVVSFEKYYLRSVKAGVNVNLNEIFEEGKRRDRRRKMIFGTPTVRLLIINYKF